MSSNNENLRSIQASLLAGGIVCALVAGLSWAGGASSSTAELGQFERYIGLGPRLGTEALARDLNLQHPAGTSLVALMARLERSGFACTPEPNSFTGYDCVWRRSISERRIARIDAHVTSSGVQVVAIRPRVDMYQR
jgi:hypothetical protein